MIYINGDSYSFTNSPNNYGKLLSELYNEPLMHKGISGSCNDRIIRTTTRDIYKLYKDNVKDVKVIVGLSFISRFELWLENETVDLRWKKFKYDDGEFESFTSAINSNWFTSNIKFNSHLPEHYHNYAKEKLLNEPPIGLIINTLHKLSMLKIVCDFFNYQFFTFWLADDSKDLNAMIKEDPPALREFSDIFDDKNSFGILNFNFVKYYRDLGYKGYDFNKYGIHAHHSEEVHKLFADKIYRKLNES